MKTRQEIMLELADERSAIQITELKEEIEHLKVKLQVIEDLILTCKNTECSKCKFADECNKNGEDFDDFILRVIRGENNVENK